MCFTSTPTLHIVRCTNVIQNYTPMSMPNTKSCKCITKYEEMFLALSVLTPKVQHWQSFIRRCPLSAACRVTECHQYNIEYNESGSKYYGLH